MVLVLVLVVQLFVLERDHQRHHMVVGSAQPCPRGGFHSLYSLDCNLNTAHFYSLILIVVTWYHLANVINCHWLCRTSRD